VQVRGLISKSIDSLPDIDRSRPDSGSMDRHFLASRRATRPAEALPVRVHLLELDENSSDDVFTADQNYGYDSVYTGFGSQGELFPDPLFRRNRV